MRKNSNWHFSLQSFFDLRALALSGSSLDRKALCFVSGKDPRLWIDDVMYDDLMFSIMSALRLKPTDNLLELGCAAGLLTVGLATRCRTYTGIDLSKKALSVAKRLKIPNATFQHADATALPFLQNSFDCVLCYDVFNNFPDFVFGAKVIDEALRVVKSGGYVCVGALPDIARQDEDNTAWQRMQTEMTQKYGAQDNFWPEENWRQRFFNKFMKWRGINPHIVCYYFNRDDFLLYGSKRSVQTEVLPLHSLSPYRDSRFNVVYKKPA